GLIRVREPVSIGGTINYYVAGQSVPGVQVSLNGDSGQSAVTGSDGIYSFNVNAGGDYTITPAKLLESPPNQGVSTLDIALIRRHLMGAKLFDLPEEVIAADANASQSISTLDIILLRRLVLGITNNLPGRLWRFVRSDFAFANPLSPWPFEAM